MRGVKAGTYKARAIERDEALSRRPRAWSKCFGFIESSGFFIVLMAPHWLSPLNDRLVWKKCGSDVGRGTTSSQSLRASPPKPGRIIGMPLAPTLHNSVKGADLLDRCDALSTLGSRTTGVRPLKTLTKNPAWHLQPSASWEIKS